MAILHDIYIYNYYIGNFAHKWQFCTNICITVIYDIVIHFSYQGYRLCAKVAARPCRRPEIVHNLKKYVQNSIYISYTCAK